MKNDKSPGHDRPKKISLNSFGMKLTIHYLIQ